MRTSFDFAILIWVALSSVAACKGGGDITVSTPFFPMRAMLEIMQAIPASANALLAKPVLSVKYVISLRLAAAPASPG